MANADTSKPRIYSHIVEGYKRVSSNPGERIDPVSGRLTTHAGVDIPVSQGTSVKAPADGQIWAKDSLPNGYGNFVIVAHPNTNNSTSFTMYGHLQNPVSLKLGESVLTGSELGLSGNTGKSTGPHLHYEERVLKPSQTIAFGTSYDNYNQFLTKTAFIDPNQNQLGFGNWDPATLDRSHLTPGERIAQAKLTDSEFNSYKDLLASIETKGKSLDESYQTTSKSGNYLGRYQLGRNTGLVEAEYLDKSGNWTDCAKQQGISSTRDFLNNPAAQDDALRRLTNKNTEFLVRNDLDLHIGEKIGDTKLTGAGLLLGAHNSRGNLKDYVLTEGQSDKGDGNGFAVSNLVALGEKVQLANVPSSTPTSPTGHWEYPADTYFNPETGLPVDGTQRIWVADTPSPSSSNTSNNNATPEASIASSATSSTHPTPPAAPTTTQLSPDATTATLPNGQVIRAGAGTNLRIDIDGNLIVDRPATGWTNADGGPSDIRQITTFDAKGQQLGTVVAQNLPGQSALIENGEERSIAIANPDGTRTTVQAHFSAGTGWIDNQSGQTVLSLEDWQAQTDTHNAHLQPGPSADNDYQPNQSTGETEAKTDTQGTTTSSTSSTSSITNLSGDPIYMALLDQLHKQDGETKLPGTQTADAGFDASGTVSDAGSPNTTTSATQGTNNANDAKPQGILVLDQNNNGLIETGERCVSANDRCYFEYA